MMGFGAAIASCMRKFVTFSGRAPRAEYWWFILFTTITSVVFDIIQPVIAAILSLVFVLPTLAAGWRRLHDTGKSGLWNLSPLLGLIPIGIGGAADLKFLVYVGFAIFVGLILYVLVLTLTRGDVGANKYGDDPYGPGSHDLSVFD